MTDYTVSGLMPVLTGDVTKFGESWFLFDTSGTFSTDKDLNCTVFLVGGGCGGEKGYGNNGGNSIGSETKGGQGGNGGSVFVLSEITIPKDTEIKITVAEADDPTGTIFEWLEHIYNCNDESSSSTVGGRGAYSIFKNNKNGFVVQNYASKGVDGVETPYGIVGSSGGGGGVNTLNNSTKGVAGGVGAGSAASYGVGGAAKNYGCGGGGGCGVPTQRLCDVGGAGKGGCVIVCVQNGLKTPVPNKLTYNGKEQFPFGENGLEGIKISGDVSAVGAGTYVAYLDIVGEDYWLDGTSDTKEVRWTIEHAVFPKPVATNDTAADGTIKFEYEGHGTAYNKSPQILNYDENIMNRDGVTSAYKAGVYSLVYSLKDTESAAWIDPTSPTGEALKMLL